MSAPVALVTFNVTGLTDAVVTVTREDTVYGERYTVDADVRGGMPLEGASQLPARFADPARAFEVASCIAGWSTRGPVGVTVGGAS